MIPRRYYIFPSNTSMPAGIHFEFVNIGPTQSFGHFNWDGYPALQKAFEATTGVQTLGTLAHPSPALSATAIGAAAAPTAINAVQAEIGAAFNKAGVLATDSMAIVVCKMQSQFGGFQVHF